MNFLLRKSSSSHSPWTIPVGRRKGEGRRKAVGLKFQNAGSEKKKKQQKQKKKSGERADQPLLLFPGPDFGGVSNSGCGRRYRKTKKRKRRKNRSLSRLLGLRAPAQSSFFLPPPPPPPLPIASRLPRSPLLPLPPPAPADDVDVVVVVLLLLLLSPVLPASLLLMLLLLLAPEQMFS